MSKQEVLNELKEEFERLSAQRLYLAEWIMELTIEIAEAGDEN